MTATQALAAIGRPIRVPHMCGWCTWHTLRFRLGILVIVNHEPHWVHGLFLKPDCKTEAGFEPATTHLRFRWGLSIQLSYSEEPGF